MKLSSQLAQLKLKKIKEAEPQPVPTKRGKSTWKNWLALRHLCSFLGRGHLGSFGIFCLGQLPAGAGRQVGSAGRADAGRHLRIRADGTLAVRVKEGQQFKARARVDGKTLVQTTQDPSSLREETRKSTIQELTPNTLVLELERGAVLRLARRSKHPIISHTLNFSASQPEGILLTFCGRIQIEKEFPFGPILCGERKPTMFRRVNLLAMGMLGLGTLLGYAAAWGNLSLPAWGAGEQAQPIPAAKENCCALPDKKEVFTAFQGSQDTPKPGNPRGATTGPTDAPGYDHPNQFMTFKPTEIAPNMEPVIVHPKQLEEAKAKLTKAIRQGRQEAQFPGLPAGRCRLDGSRLQRRRRNGRQSHAPHG